jgi:hypothetical protein
MQSLMKSALALAFVLVACGKPSGAANDAGGGGDDDDSDGGGAGDGGTVDDAAITGDGWVPGDAPQPTGACASGALVSGRLLATNSSVDDFVLSKIKLGPHGEIFAAGQLSGGATLEAGTANARTIYGSQVGSSVIVKYTSAGALAWASSITSYFGYATALEPLADGSVLVGGYFSQQLTLDYGLSSQIVIPAMNDGDNIYIAKLDANGHAVWARTAYSGAIDGVLDIAARPDGTFVAAGYFGDGYDHTFTFPAGQAGPITASAPTDAWETGWVGSFDAMGRIGWLRMLGGSSRVDKAWNLAFAGNGDILVEGAFATDMTYATASGAQTIQQTGNTAYGTSATYLARLSAANGAAISMHANGGHSAVSAFERDAGGLRIAAETDRASAFDPASSSPVNGSIPWASYLVTFDENLAYSSMYTLGTGFDNAQLTTLGSDAFLFSGMASTYRRFANGPHGEIDPTPITTPGEPAGFVACYSTSDHRIVWSTSTGSSSTAALAADGSIVAIVTFEQDVTINQGKPSMQSFHNEGFRHTSLMLRFTP